MQCVTGARYRHLAPPLPPPFRRPPLMKNILITTIGSAGDIHPFIAVGIALARRGCRVTVLTNPYYEERIRAAGLLFAPVGTREDLFRVLEDPALTKPWRSPLLIIRELIGGSVGPTIAAVNAQIAQRKVDLIVRHHISLGSRWVAQKQNIPCVTCVLAPLFMMNPNAPAVHHPSQSLNASPRIMRMRLAFNKYLLRLLYDRPLNRQRRIHGFPKERDLFRTEIQSCDKVLGLWSRAFRPPIDGDPANVTITGFCTFDSSPAQQADNHDLTTFLEECKQFGPGLLVFTLGTSVVHHSNGFYELAATAASALKLPAVLLVGDAKYAPKTLPQSVRAFPYAPYSLLFPAATAIIHHGGIGTTAAAMAHGKPTVIIPFANDEFDNAARAQQLGVSLTLLATRLSAARLRDTLAQLTSQPAFSQAAHALATRMAADQGPSDAADAILGLLTSR